MANHYERARCNALTIKSNDGRISSLLCPVTLLSPIDGTVLKSGIKGLWDTGASRSAIEISLAKELNLVPTGEVPVLTANGLRIAHEYCVTVQLPNGMTLPLLPVTDGEIGNGVEMLLGMDIITQGDFSITNHRQLILSFRTPSIESVDYVLQAQVAHRIVGKSNPRKK